MRSKPHSEHSDKPRGVQATGEVTLTERPKHLFIVQSGITAVMSELIAEHLSLSPYQIAIAHYRGNYPVHHEAAHLIEDTSLDLPSWKRRDSFRRQVGGLWERVDECLDGDRYILYAPQSASPSYRALGMNSQCVQVNYVEEGTDALLARPNTTRGPIPGSGHKRPAISVGCFGLRGLDFGLLMNRTYQTPNQSVFYHITPHAFPWARKRVLLEPNLHPIRPEVPRVILAMSPLPRASHSTVSYAGRGSLALAELLPALSRLSSILTSRGYRRMAVKFHMYDKQLPRILDVSARQQEVVEVLSGRGKLDVEWLDDSEILEPLGVGRRMLGMATSALHYARLFKGEAYLMKSVLSTSGQEWLSEMLAGMSESKLSTLPDVQELPSADDGE